MSARRFAFDGFRGEAAAELEAADPAAEARRLLDPASALETVHWGRNYLYRARLATAGAELDVVVKQFRETSLRDRLRRRLAGSSKAARSWSTARALEAAGIPTPQPLLFAEAADAAVSIFVTRHLAGRIEARYLLRARNAGVAGADGTDSADERALPPIDGEALIAALARLARRLHDAGFWHRDFSVGNLLVEPGPATSPPGPPGEIALVDLNRCRRPGRVTLSQRMRDLCRLPLERPADRALLLQSYFGGPPPPGARWLYELDRRSFHGRHRWKPRLRAFRARLRSWLVARGAHPHIPASPAGAAARDRIVWDELSDQPHSHAGRLERLRIRLSDLPQHARAWAALAGATPRVARRYLELCALRDARPREPFAWPGVGVALRPWPRDPAALLAAFDALGVRQALLRLHPWQERHDDEEALARALAERGVELAFALPQVRELVRDPARWRSAVDRLGRRFLPFGRRFQIGQAINRSKWGIWNPVEYLALAADAAAILRGLDPGIELLGPAVIDFEAHATAAVVNLRHPELRFDALASLLYVDRRGAPENRQLGFDTAGKVTLLAAIAETARLVGRRRQWITEVNWPLAEGPHSPAGRSVAVGEPAQADYLARFYLEALGTGYVERVFWWQLVAKGYGLIDPMPDGALRRRPAFAALATLARVLDGALCHGAQPAPPGARLVRFGRPGRAELWAGWAYDAPGGSIAWRPPRPLVGGLDRDGRDLVPSAAEIALTGSPAYFELAPE